jgi:hypothetical protein
MQWDREMEIRERFAQTSRHAYHRTVMALRPDRSPGWDL